MRQGSLLPYIHDAARHVEAVVGGCATDLIQTVRAMASYDFAMLAYGYHATVSMHSAAMTAAELLCLAEHLERAGGGPPEEIDAPVPCHSGLLEHDAGVLGTAIRKLTQREIAEALAHFRQAVEQRGLDLTASLALEMKGPAYNAPTSKPVPTFRCIERQALASTGGQRCGIARGRAPRTTGELQCGCLSP